MVFDETTGGADMAQPEAPAEEAATETPTGTESADVAVDSESSSPDGLQAEGESTPAEEGHEAA